MHPYNFGTTGNILMKLFQPTCREAGVITCIPVRMCASRAWPICSACKNLRAQHPLKDEILCPEICPLGWVNMHLYNFFVCGPKFTRFLLSNVGGVVVDQLCVRFLTWRPVPGIVAIKVESCRKSRRNLDAFLALPNFRGRAFRKLYARYHRCLVTRRLEKSHEDINTNAKVIGVHTLNFKANFKIFTIRIFLGSSVPVGVCAR